MSISPCDDIIEADEVIRAANEVRDEIEELLAAKEEADEEQLDLDDEDEDYQDQYDELETKKDDLDSEIEDLKTDNLELLEFADDLEAYRITGTLISEDYFTTYAEEQADEMLNINVSDWPLNCIDWDLAADALKADYSVVEYDGTTFYYQ